MAVEKLYAAAWLAQQVAWMLSQVASMLQQVAVALQQVPLSSREEPTAAASTCFKQYQVAGCENTLHNNTGERHSQAKQQAQ